MSRSSVVALPLAVGIHSKIVHQASCMAYCRATASEIASALCYLHSKDILHGDLCSGNILLSASSRDKRGFITKVADFGLSRTAQTAIVTSTYGTVSPLHPLVLTGIAGATFWMEKDSGTTLHVGPVF